MELRKHQAEMQQVCEDILSGAKTRKILCDICAGGGKTAMALLAFNMLVNKVVDTCIVIVPRDSLKFQFERDCIDKRFFQGNILRASPNEENMARGTQGYITTYQAIVANTDLHKKQLKDKRYLCICDELHHVKDESGFGESCFDIIENATISIQMSGTLETQNGFIKTIPYKDKVPDKTNTEEIRWINYSRSEALRDGAILPVEFNLFDCSGTSNGKDFNSIGDNREFLSAAINSNFSKQILEKCVSSYLDHKKINSFAKLLTIDSTIKNAESTKRHLESLGLKCVIATSADSDCSKNIDKFKKDIDVLCSVGVAYEGLDVPPTTHLCLLTHIRSKSWIAQAIGRVQRRYEDKAIGFVFAPKDELLENVIIDIQNDVIHEHGERNVSDKAKSSFNKEKKENEYFTFMTKHSVISDMTISQSEKYYRDLIHKKIEEWVAEKRVIRVGNDIGISKSQDLKRRKVAYRMLQVKYKVNGVNEMDIIQLEESLSYLDTILNRE